MGMACASAGNLMCQLVADDRVESSMAGLPAMVYCCSQKMETGVQSSILHTLYCCHLLACHFFRTRAGTPGST